MLDLNYLFQSFSQPHQYYCPKYCFFFVFRACAQAKIWTSLANLFTSFLQFWPSFPYAFPFYTQFCFAWICGWLTFQKRDKFNLQRLVSKQRNWQSIFPQYITWFSYTTLSGLVRISKTRYRWKGLPLLTFLPTNLKVQVTFRARNQKFRSKYIAHSVS